MSAAGDGEPSPRTGSIVRDATRNEQTKLLATGLDNIAVAFVVIGVVTPVTAVSFGMTNAPPLSFGNSIFVAVWLCFGGVVHRIARRTLRSLKP